ncbi:MAG: amidohydrolase family protein [Pseudomonadota bacterium]
MKGVIYHNAKWVYPISRPPIENGVIAIRDHRIIDIGSKSDFRLCVSDKIIDHGDVAILPSLVNTHTHLEISALQGKFGKDMDFVEWLYLLLEERKKLDQDDVSQGIAHGINMAIAHGTGLIADISNTGMSIEHLKNSFIKSVIFIEVIGLHLKTANIYLERYKNLQTKGTDNTTIAIAGHAPYSVAPKILKKIFDSTKQGYPRASIHLAESRHESDFLMGKGDLLAFMNNLGFMDKKGWVSPGKSPVAYLDDLDCLTKETLCVHMVNVSDADMEILANKKPLISLCPRSNKTLQAGRPPIEKFLNLGLIVTLGTDSLASNNELSIFKEMAELKRIAPDIPSYEIIKMATINGAIALNMENSMGSIDPGKSDLLIALPVESQHPKELYEEIVSEGHKKDIKWIASA